jgi:ATP-binding cassette subfamily B protein
VAHRIKTVMASDLILVMDAGAITDRGTHEELMRRCELYQKLVRTQLLQDA